MASQDIVDWLEGQLADRGIYPTELARMAGIDQGIISRVLNRERKPSAETLIAIARALRVPHDEVLRIAGVLPPEPGTDSIVEEGRELLKQMNEDTKRRALRLLRSELEAQEQEEKHREDVARTKRRRSTASG